MLLDFVDTKLDANQIGDLLTMAGFELEGIEAVEGEPVLDIKVMSNRGDGLSVFGLAREVLAKDADSKPTDLYERAATRFRPDTNGTPNPVAVRVETTDCTRYACQAWTGITNGDAPEWIQTRLRRAGQRPISLLVDLTNYVMLELGQPLHAFDLDKLGDQIVVRKAVAGEKLTTLNGVEHELRDDQMMICDANRPVAVAGVMGGLDTEVDERTTRLLLESAHFLNTSVRRTRKQLGLSTDASYRFERSVDPEGVVAAIHRFAELLGIPGSEIVDVYPNPVRNQPVALRIDRANRLLGMAIKDVDAQRYLERLGMEVVGHGDPFYVVPPSWRPDIVREEDLIEEIGRVHGYDRIPERLPEGSSVLGGSHGVYLAEDRIREATLRLGFVQTISHSLRSTHPLDASGDRVGPRNPASPEMAWLRNSLLPCLAEAASRNGARDLSLFEIGRTFGPAERKHLALMAMGARIPMDRKGAISPSVDFYVLKGAVETALGAIGARLDFEPSSHDARLHPTRQATILIERTQVGVIGQLHPEVAESVDLPTETYVAEVDLDAVFGAKSAELEIHSISRHPSVRRDVAVLAPKSLAYRDIEAAVRSAAGSVLEKLTLFDVFEGKWIPDGSHSLGITIQLRKPDGTFTDEEANQVRDAVVAALSALGATMR